MEIRWKDNSKARLEVIQKQGVTFLQFPNLLKTGIVAHGFSTRLGGVSEGIYASMNLSYTRGDVEAHVRENYQRIADAIGVPVESIVTSGSDTYHECEKSGEGGLRGRGNRTEDVS